MADEPETDSQAETVIAEPPMNGGPQPENISESVRKARNMIPVGDRGLRPETYAQWIDIAKDVCKAYLMLPPHLHNNPSVVAGLLEIASRFNLSPYMLASKTYVQGGRLCFESQAFGAILYASHLLLGRLRYEFNGEGEDMTCTVSGRFRDDPDTICMATTPTLKQLHPGTTQKDGKTFVKGSPLWEKDPEQQLAYFAQRRWTRRFAPDCVAGMYTREEAEEWPDYGQIGTPLTADRLGRLDTGEGWNEENAALDLAALAPEVPEVGPVEVLPPEMAAESASTAASQPAGRRKAAGRGKTAPAAKGRSARPGRRPRTAVEMAADRAEKPRGRPTPPTPLWLNYVRDTEDWIKTVDDADKGEARWGADREKRDQVKVPIGERSRLRAMLDRKVASLRLKAKKDLLDDGAA